MPRISFVIAVLCASAALISLVQPAHAQASATPVTLPPAPTVPLAPIPMPPPLTVTPPPSTASAATTPLLMPSLPNIPIDPVADNIGIAQQMTHAKGYQARILWVDGTANIASINTGDKIKALMTQAKTAGFNTVVFDVKPIVGFTLYPSRFAPKLTDWKGNGLPIAFDPLAFFIQYAHADGMQLVANLSTFGEGHKYFNQGLGYQNPSWQTTMYIVTRTVKMPLDATNGLTIGATNQISKDDGQLAAYTDGSNLHHPVPGAFVDVMNFDARVVAQIDGQFLGTVNPDVPPRGVILVGTGRAGDALRQKTRIGDIVTYTATPQYVSVLAVPEQKITVFVNPNDPAVQQHELDIVREIVTNYQVDGLIFDDRLRYAALNADFSALTRAQFEKYVGHSVKWPDDVFQINPYPNQEIIKGPLYDAWLVFRTLTIRNWLAEARAVVKAVRPQATVSVYVGSWYGEYAYNGSNWAADDFDGPFPFLSSSYQKTGFAGLLDWATTGCYYTTATVSEGTQTGSPGATVEGAGQLSNRAVNDDCFVYAGLYAAQFPNDPVGFARCIQAATASTQGVMVFDLSQVNQYNLWPVFQQAFAQPAMPPQAVPGLLDSIREQKARQKAQGIVPPPVVVYGGVAGTGL